MTLYIDRKNPRISASASHPENLPHGDWTPVADTPQALTEATAQPPDPAQLADEIEAARDRLVALLNMAGVMLPGETLPASTRRGVVVMTDATAARLREMGE